MNENLKKVNEIISLCDEVLSIIEENGMILPNHAIYRKYKEKISAFCRENNLINPANASYAV